ncbi:hypothetical protein SARC_08832 [Sphaeroforma arctica JP610]|uniref:Eukaryotic translation initiation factor 3 subunit F n=1 Tax=Sphaeroforma arctica JP610 TaxID=667725 RepID=A0A0L0FQD3_9EUKA|nr:hypothetical protein SARC_08832 [Sphaeroforma arctica JP610]KNC78751.1 hypothetical protein SARC_08832 [Sphaeroforma arctica JP610]|eukprot:XP_014152653.1 hypothetical protein SARC_08832 [Sphaeroforma arctica JP610]
MAATPTQPLFLADTKLNQSVKIRPVVLFSIVDHFMRRDAGQGRVIGTLLGHTEEGVVHVTNCFPVPHGETEDQVAVNMEFHQTMFQLHQKVNPREQIVGWYATGNTISSHSVLIHEFYGRETRSPVHLTLNTELKSGDPLAVKCYSSSPIGAPNNATGVVFTPVESELRYLEAERVGLDTLERSKDAPNGTLALMTETEQLEKAIVKMLEMVGHVKDYVTQVLDGRLETPNNQVGRHLMEVISSVPEVEGLTLDKMFNNSLLDVMMIVYLSNITRTQLKIAERFDNDWALVTLTVVRIRSTPARS